MFSDPFSIDPKLSAKIHAAGVMWPLWVGCSCAPGATSLGISFCARGHFLWWSAGTDKEPLAPAPLRRMGRGKRGRTPCLTSTVCQGMRTFTEINPWLEEQPKQSPWHLLGGVDCWLLWELNPQILKVISLFLKLIFQFMNRNVSNYWQNHGQ